MQKNTTKLWGSAFTKPPNEQAVLFAAGRDVVGTPPADEVLIPYEIEASLAYVNGLFDVGLIDTQTKIALVDGLHALEEISPLGAAAAYGSTLPVSKEKINSHLKLKVFGKNPQILADLLTIQEYKGKLKGLAGVDVVYATTWVLREK